MYDEQAELDAVYCGICGTHHQDGEAWHDDRWSDLDE